MAFKRCMCIVYSMSDKDFDDLEVFDDFEFVDFFILWLRFIKYKIFPREINEDGGDSQHIWDESRRHKAEDNP